MDCQGQNGWIVSDVFMCPLPSTLHSSPCSLPSLLSDRVDYNSLVLWLPVKSGNGETLPQSKGSSEGGSRRRVGYLFLWFSPCTATLSQLCAPSKGHWSSLGGPHYTNLSSQFCKPSFLYSYGTRNVRGPQFY